MVDAACYVFYAIHYDILCYTIVYHAILILYSIVVESGILKYSNASYSIAYLTAAGYRMVYYSVVSDIMGCHRIL